MENDDYEGELHLCGYDANGVEKFDYILNSGVTGFENDNDIFESGLLLYFAK